MRHRKSRTRLNLKPAHARMQARNLVTSMLLYEKLRTTKKRAQVIAPEIDKIVRYAKTHTPHVAIRHINALVTDKNACRKVMEVYVQRFAKRASGLTRITPAGARLGDGAEMVDMEFVDGAEVVAAAEAPKAEKAPKKTAAKKSSSKK